MVGRGSGQSGTDIHSRVPARSTTARSRAVANLLHRGWGCNAMHPPRACARGSPSVTSGCQLTGRRCNALLRDLGLGFPKFGRCFPPRSMTRFPISLPPGYSQESFNFSCSDFAFRGTTLNSEATILACTVLVSLIHSVSFRLSELGSEFPFKLQTPSTNFHLPSSRTNSGTLFN